MTWFTYSRPEIDGWLHLYSHFSHEFLLIYDNDIFLDGIMLFNEGVQRGLWRIQGWRNPSCVKIKRFLFFPNNLHIRSESSRYSGVGGAVATAVPVWCAVMGGDTLTQSWRHAGKVDCTCRLRSWCTLHSNQSRIIHQVDGCSWWHFIIIITMNQDETVFRDLDTRYLPPILHYTIHRYCMSHVHMYLPISASRPQRVGRAAPPGAEMPHYCFNTKRLTLLQRHFFGTLNNLVPQ